MTEITHTHEGILITYDENANLWRFTLRGRDRSTDSLSKAKEAIDKPVATKAKPFEKIQVWYVNVNDKFHHYMNPDTDTMWIGFACGMRWAWLRNMGGPKL